MSQTIGIMEGAYFVGRVELLNWLNEFLQLDYKKVEQAASGVAYCQLIDALYPGQINLSKVNWNAKFDYEFIKNFQILQAAFDKIGIDKRIDVNTLVKGKFQDNLEFMQWMKKYFDLHYNGTPYDAVARKNAALKASGQSVVAKKSTGAKATGAAKPKAAVAASPAKPAAKAATKPATPKATGAPAKAAPKTAEKPAAAKVIQAPKAKQESNAQVEELNEKIAELTAQLEEMKNVAVAMEKERDFYFGKLRQIEIICQENEDSVIAQQIVGVLTTPDDGEAPQEEETAAEEVVEEVEEVQEEEAAEVAVEDSDETW